MGICFLRILMTIPDKQNNDILNLHMIEDLKIIMNDYPNFCDICFSPPKRQFR